MQKFIVGISLAIVCIMLIAISTTSNNARAQADAENQNLRDIIVKLREIVVEPGQWQNLNAPSGWKVYEGQTPQCRKNGAWIEFRGAYFLNGIQSQGTPVELPDFLPDDCQPKIARSLNVDCWVSGLEEVGLNGMVCAADFKAEGKFQLLLNKEISYLYFDGLRIASE